MIPGQRVAGVADALDRPWSARPGSGRRARRRPARRGPPAIAAPTPVISELAASPTARSNEVPPEPSPLRRPVDQHPDREHERDQDDRRAEAERRPAPAPERVRPRRARRARGRAGGRRGRAAAARCPRAATSIRSTSTMPERGGRGAVEARLVGDVDLAGERVEAHDRDGAEVARSRTAPRAGRRPRSPATAAAGPRVRNVSQRAAAHRPGGVLELRVDPAQRRRARAAARAGR